MKRYILISVTFCCLLMACASETEGDHGEGAQWTSLMDNSLSAWDIYLSYAIPYVFRPGK